tara:strand:+ start:19028 stop:19327 length:300 start_codon:yes stop_codon:yes gene_type:complete
MKNHKTRIRRDVRCVIEEMDAAYSTFSQYNYMNSDYAGFAGMALGQFRNALRNQTLTREELERMLRDGIQKHRQEGHETDWARFVATHVAQSSNTNSVL